VKVAVVHYHLEPGGVTRVIENTLDAFAKLPEQTKFVALSGRPYQGQKIQDVAVVEGLDYITPSQTTDSTRLRENLEKAARAALGTTPDLWHVHNHSLGKNPAFPEAIYQLAERGHPLLLHIHDFAEDGRPGNYHALSAAHNYLYPAGSHIRYAALNRRDHHFLSDLSCNHPPPILLPNAIPQPTTAKFPCEQVDLPEQLHLYPVRAVRRKNLGELALLAAAHSDLHFANSLGPTNPEFLPIYERWKAFSAERNLPLTYGIGENSDLSFPEVVNASQALVTTSVAEGFGLGFLEPWTFGKNLFGRNIPEVTEDFANLGLELDHLYSRMELPLELLPEQELESRIASALKKLYTDYEHPLPKNALGMAKSSICQNGNIDFGRLDETFQEMLVSIVSDSPSLAGEIRVQANLGNLSNKTQEANASAVRKNFSQDAYAKRLWTVYNELVASKGDRVENLNGNVLLKHFLNPARMNLLRTD
jgi:glycosyltransferase involved in cell wall biosynthesis